MTKESRAPLAVFLGLTFGLSAVFWGLIVAAGSMQAHGGIYVLALMWCPGASALATKFVFRGGGTRGGRFADVARWAGVAYVLPLSYGAAGYGIVWIAGLGAVDVGRFHGSILGFLVVGFLQSLLSATGEEIGSRGFMVPALAQRMSFGSTAVVSGVIWAAWHVPIIVLADYNAGTPAWYAVLCFTVGITSLAVALAWLTLRSGSFWPAAILHAAHNLFVQGFFDVVTVDTGWTRWLTGEFGASLAAALGVMAWLFWRRRGSVVSVCASSATPVPELSPSAMPSHLKLTLARNLGIAVALIAAALLWVQNRREETDDRKRPFLTVYVVGEPLLAEATRTIASQSFRYRYPEGPDNAEAFAVLPDGDVTIVSKGYSGTVAFYRLRRASIVRAISYSLRLATTRSSFFTP